MEQLSPLDSMFVFNEQPRNPGHIGGFAIFDPSTAEGGIVRFKDIIARTVEAGKIVPYMRRRLVRVPFDLDFPYWVNDENFDPEFHVRHIALPKPGDWRQLCILVARIYSRPLDFNRPLWETYVIEGLDNIPGLPPGCFAVMNKMHHACIDGQSAADIGLATTDLSPKMKELKDPGGWVADKMPTPAELLYRSSVNNMTKPYRYMEMMGRQAPQMSDIFKAFQSGEVKAPQAAPKSRFSKAVSGNHVVDAAFFPLDTIKAIKSKAGTTVNDVAVAIVSGAMRSYLSEIDELPEESLVTQCPINIRTAGSKGGNEVVSMMVPLRTDVADAKARLMAVSESTQAGKDYTKAVGAKNMLDQAQFASTALMAMGSRTANEQQLANSSDPVQNTVTTNVPGSPVPSFAYGATQLFGVGLGVVTDGIGLFHSISSYVDQFSISVTACREALPDPANYTQKLRDSFDDLVMGVLGDKSLCIGVQDHPIPPVLAMTTPTIERLDDVLRYAREYIAKHGEVTSGSTALKTKKSGLQGDGTVAKNAPARKQAPARKKPAAKAKRPAAKKAAAKKSPARKAAKT